MPFQRVIRRKSKLSANYPAESFSIPGKVKISLFKGLSLLLQIILDEKSARVNTTTLDLKEKLKKHGVTENNNLIFHI
jgi:hypothetical protein